MGANNGQARAGTVTAETKRAAAAIANARGMRRGAPPIVNVLDLLPANLFNEVVEDAEAVLRALRDGAPDQHAARHHQTIDAMERRGGGFVAALALAWRKADPDNHARLYSVFGMYYDQYAPKTGGGVS